MYLLHFKTISYTGKSFIVHIKVASFKIFVFLRHYGSIPQMTITHSTHQLTIEDKHLFPT